MPYDYYDEQIEYLTREADPELIEEQWNNGIGLFQFANLSGTKGDARCGCLTMIREDPTRCVQIHPSVDEILTKEIRADTRIPADPDDITPECFPALKEWQLRLDEYRKKYDYAF